MPETAEAPTQNHEKTQAQPVELPQVPEGEATASGGQFDLLLDMDVPVTVALGSTQVPVRRLLQLGPGAVLKLEKPVDAPVDLYLKDSKFAEAEVVVVDNRFAVRIKTITGAAVASEG
jgi:flagellar motor switch protein FliN/FliY